MTLQLCSWATPCLVLTSPCYLSCGGNMNQPKNRWCKHACWERPKRVWNHSYIYTCLYCACNMYIYIYRINIHTSHALYVYCVCESYYYTYIHTYIHTITYHYITLHYIPFHSIPLHYVTFHSITFHSIPFHSITLHCAIETHQWTTMCFHFGIISWLCHTTGKKIQAPWSLSQQL